MLNNRKHLASVILTIVSWLFSNCLKLIKGCSTSILTFIMVMEFKKHSILQIES